MDAHAITTTADGQASAVGADLPSGIQNPKNERNRT